MSILHSVLSEVLVFLAQSGSVTGSKTPRMYKCLTVSSLTWCSRHNRLVLHLDDGSHYYMYRYTVCKKDRLYFLVGFLVNAVSVLLLFNNKVCQRDSFLQLLWLILQESLVSCLSSIDKGYHLLAVASFFFTLVWVRKSLALLPLDWHREEQHTILDWSTSNTSDRGISVPADDSIVRSRE